MHRNNRFIGINLKLLIPFLPFILFSVVFIIGLLIGNIVVGKFELLNEFASSSFNSFISVRQNGNIASVVYNSFIRTVPIYLCIFLMGTSIIGSVCTPFLLCAFGFNYGLISGYLYTAFKLEGIMFNCLILMPPTLIILFGLVLLSKEAFRFSISLANICIKLNKPINIYSDFKTYCIKGLTTLISAFVGIIFDVCLSYLFINYFNFS